VNDSYEMNDAILLNTLRLLYVEDDPDALQELSRFLRKRVSTLTVASNGLEALTLCRAQRFDVILTDLRMPEMDGLTFIGLLRETGVHTPVIITSAFSDSETILKAVDLGIVKYCVKPIDTDELLGSLFRIAAERLSDVDELALPHNRLLDRQQRLDAEKALKSGYAHLLKKKTGKGPKEVHVSLGTDGIDVWATDVLTPIELTLMNNSGNTSLLTYFRNIFYAECRSEFEELVMQIFQTPATLEDIQIGPSENTDRLIFRFR